MPNNRIEALYIHVPFCKARCNYCDFHTRAVACDDAAMDEYVENLVIAIRRLSKAGHLGQVKTVYFGGGTPSYLGQSRLSMLLYTLGLSMELLPEMEVTLEANPDSVTENLVKDLKALGITRISLGVQSLDPEELKTLGRVHSREQALEAIRVVQKYELRLSVDVMCGHGSDENLKQTISTLLDMGLEHVSVYPLTIEEGTPLDRAVEAGTFTPLDEDASARQMELAAAMLEAAGLKRYEVASYAVPGQESQHNQAYWTGVNYLGLGEGAASCLPVAFEGWDTLRMLGHPVPNAFPEGAYRVRYNTLDEEPEFLTETQAALEDLMLGMRRSQGVTEEHLAQVSACCPKVCAAFEKLQAEGLVCLEARRYKPTERGWLMGNEIFGEIWACI